jgi:hypothetical protein
MGITKEHSDMREHDVKRDITTRADIVVMVDAFYRKVRQDDLLGGVFHEVIKDDWPDHLDKMYRFWHTVLLHEREYFGSPFPPHAVKCLQIGISLVASGHDISCRPPPSAGSGQQPAPLPAAATGIARGDRKPRPGA